MCDLRLALASRRVRESRAIHDDAWSMGCERHSDRRRVRDVEFRVPGRGYGMGRERTPQVTP
jgi:hypothetical protein